MEVDEFTLSDVHVDREVVYEKTGARYTVVETRFRYKTFSINENDECQTEKKEESIKQDKDGDLVVERNPALSQYHEVITIEHTMETTLKDVGFQVWHGCLLLCDYILENAQKFDGCHALELGGGVGLASITMATVADSLLCTDVGMTLLQTCAKNAEINKHLFKYLSPGRGQTVLRVKELDWTKGPQIGKGPYEWTKEDIAELEVTRVLLAADVIYDDGLTDAFFGIVHKLMCLAPPKVLYLALERRLNFTLTEIDVASPAYTYYLSCLRKLCENKNGADVIFTAKQVDTDFKQYFEYKRTKYLELWTITSKQKHM